MIRAADINGRVLFSEGNHQFIWLGADEDENDEAVQANQYLVVHNGKATLFDPGGVHLFARVASAVSQYVSLDQIETIIYSHQDPDVSSGIALWMGITKAKIYISDLWVRFLPHFGIIDQSRIIAIEKTGRRLPTETALQFVPAHFLHSTGNYTVYDPAAKALFSADIGTAVFEKSAQYLFVEDFEKHVPLMEPFHRRYMASNSALRKWVEIVSRLDVKMILPQHGALFMEANVRRFLAWLKDLKCGVDIIDSIYEA